MLVGDSYLRYQMTAAVTEQNEGCLELIIVKEPCFLEAWYASFRAVIWSTRIKKLPEVHNESFMVAET